MQVIQWGAKVVIVGVSVMVVACSSAPKATQVVSPEQNLKTEPNKALQIVNPATKVVGTANNIQVQDIRTSSVDNQLFVQVEVKNSRGRRDAFV